MIFVIINRTDKVIPITRTSMEKVNLLPHKPYVLETLHTPEIHFWQHCTDSRLVVMTDTNTIERYLRVLKNQEKNNTAPQQAQPVTITNTDVTVAPEVNNEAVNEPVEEVVNTKYTEEQLVALKVVDLKAILTEMDVTIPTSINKAGLVQLILDNQ